MATIAGTLTRPSGEPAAGVPIRIQLVDGPYSGEGSTRAVVPQVFWTHPITGAYSFTLAEGLYSVRIPGTTEFLIETPSGSGTYTIEAIHQTYGDRTKTQVLAWAMAEQFALLNQNGILTSSSVTWPDGRTGTYTCTQVNTLFGVPDAFTVTYVAGLDTYTVTQSAVTRNDSGDITNAPSPSIA